MAPNDTTRDFTVNDIVYHVGELAGKVEGMGREIGLLRTSISALHCLKEAEIANIAELSKSNATAIAAITEKMNSTRDYLKGGFTTGRIAALFFLWLVTTFATALGAGYVTIHNVKPATAQTATSPTTTP